MAKTVSTAKELGKAICSKENRIIITGSLGNKVLRIEAIGSVAWGVVIAGIGLGIASACTTAATGGIAAPAGTVAQVIAIPTVVVASGGISTAAVIANIAAVSGISTLSVLREYKAEREGDHVVLTKRW